MRRVPFMNITIDNLTMPEALDEIEKLVENGTPSFVLTPNVDHVVQMEKNERLREAYRNAALVLTDGKPLVWVSRLYGTPIREKVSGADLFPLLCERAAQKRYRMFFLGAAEGVAAAAAHRLEQRYPGLNVAGVYSPPYGFENQKEEMQKIIRNVREAKPNILIVGLGCPKQEYLMYEHGQALGVPVALGLGASLDYEAGQVRRAPAWMSNCGLEWFYRLLQDPSRLARRYLVDDLSFFPLILKYHPRRKRRTKGGLPR